MKRCPVLVRMGENVPEGNPRLVRLGGVAFEKACDLPAPLRREAERRDVGVEQGSLF